MVRSDFITEICRSLLKGRQVLIRSEKKFNNTVDIVIQVSDLNSTMPFGLHATRVITATNVLEYGPESMMTEAVKQLNFHFDAGNR